MKPSIPSLVPNRIDRDPAIIRGVTAPELYLIIAMAIPLGLFGVLVTGLIFQSFFVGIAFGMMTTVCVLIVGVLMIAAIKRERPHHYLTHAGYIKVERLGFKVAPFIHKTTRFKVSR